MPIFSLMIMRWRRKWQPTPVFLPGESQGLGSLVGCRLWDRTESDTTEANEASIISLGFPSGTWVKNPVNAGDVGSIPGLGRSPALEKEMATHFSIFAWRIPWTVEAYGLHSTGSQRAGHDRETNTYSIMR